MENVEQIVGMIADELEATRTSFETRVREDYDKNYIVFFGLGTAAAGWVGHWCMDNGIQMPAEEDREKIANKLLGWAQ